ncbi:hypothetical protein RZ72_04190 [Apilactobacillus kunkeei]|uniref:Uncharacterized protein n=1 Tax=Apilactobacillus kunkeei TaxID=148814 RepID=A0A0N0UW16_9LACO|nr:hypothetical protein RZ72_04190 [Apilactobacillus kunkeei]
MNSKKHHSPETVKQIRDFFKYTKVAIVNIILLSLCYDVYDFIRNSGRMDLANVLFISATSSMVVFSAVAFDKDDFLSMSKIVISPGFMFYTASSILWSLLFIYLVGMANQMMTSSHFEPVIQFIVNFLRYVFPSISLQMVFIYILFVVYRLIMHRD